MSNRSLNEPDRLLGRSAEQSILLNAYFACLSKGQGSRASVILIHGDSGQGKTKLAESLRSHVSEDDGYFIRGKFNKLSYGSASRPYSGISSAFAEYCSAVERRDDETWSEVAKKLSRQIREDERSLLVEAIPSLQKILVGECQEDIMERRRHSCSACEPIEEEEMKMPVSVDISSESGSHRFIYLIKRVVSVISSIGDPIVCLIDDIQWANKTEIDILRAIMMVAVNPFMFIFTCRPGDHAFLRITDEYEGKTEIMLRSLSRNSVRELVAEILSKDDVEDCTSLANFISRVTSGNPFFIRQQIISLCDEGLIRFGNNGWVWDINEIEQMHGDVVGDVVMMLAEKMKRLPSLTVTALQICSCIGSRIDFYILGLILRESNFVAAPVAEENETLARMATSISSQEGLLTVTKDGKGVTFTHDSVNEAAYSLLDPGKEASYHLKLGQTLQRSMCPNLFRKHLFAIAGQLARGNELITDEKDRIETAKIFLSAGEKSQSASAFPEAHFFFSKGMQLLRDDDWTKNYRLCCDIHMKVADTAAIIADFSDMEKCLAILFQRCKESSMVDFLNATYIQVRSMTSRDDPAGLDICMEALSLVGVGFPSRNLSMHTLLGLVQTRRFMNKGANELLQLPPVSDKQMIATQRVLQILAVNACSFNQKLMPIVCFKTLQLNLAHGISNAIPSAVAFYGCMLGRFCYSPAEAAKYSEIALALQEKLKDDETKATVMLYTYGILFTLTKELSDCPKPLQSGYDAGVITGDIASAMGCATVIALTSFLSGRRLVTVAKILDKLRTSMSEYNMTKSLRENRIYRNAVDCCLGALDTSRYFVPAETNDATGSSGTNALVNEQAKFIPLVVAVIFGDTGIAWDLSEKLHRFSSLFASTVWPYICSFYRGLSATSILHISKSRKPMRTAKSCLKHLRKGQKKSVRNISHQLYLLEAEYAVFRKKYSSAEKHYSRAIEHAAKAGVTHEHAHACERFGSYHLMRKNHSAAYEHIREAHRLYAKWGSRPKCEALKKKFPRLDDEELARRQDGHQKADY